MMLEEKLALYEATLRRIRDYSGPAFRSSEYAKTQAKKALKQGERKDGHLP